MADNMDAAYERQARFHPFTAEPLKVGLQTRAHCSFCNSLLLLFGGYQQEQVRGLNASITREMRALVCPVCDLKAELRQSEVI